jgi:quinol monooxygenase YgiN
MIVVAGWIRVAADHRQAYLEGCAPVVGAARAAQGCLDFAISADLIDAERINIFEQWTTLADVERFRGSGISDDQQSMIIDAHVEQHDVGSSITLT